MLTLLQVQNVCNAGLWSWPPANTSGKPCKYMATETNSKGNYVHMCTKLAPAEFAKIQKNSPGYGGTRTGDNCGGYIYLKHKRQGYDVP